MSIIAHAGAGPQLEKALWHPPFKDFARYHEVISFIGAGAKAA
jgi:hypothetical protein